MHTWLSITWCFASERDDQGGTSSGGESSRWRIFTFKELQTATIGFSVENKLGEGWHGIVYSGRTSGGEQIAVKKMKATNTQALVEFMSEVDVIARVKHENLLGFRGYCEENDQRLLVYDYMSNLCLYSHLHGKNACASQLDWSKRIKIAIGTAQGLMYLHHETKPPIIHRDIKARNLLLDHDFKPVISDFRFAKQVQEGLSNVTSRVKGTLGYLAPEYAMTGKVTQSCDVYSFGILLLELISRRKPIEKLPGGVLRTITEWARPLIDEEKFEELVDPTLNGNFDAKQLMQVIKIAALCVQREAGMRPNMKEVVILMRELI